MEQLVLTSNFNFVSFTLGTIIMSGQIILVVKSSLKINDSFTILNVINIEVNLISEVNDDDVPFNLD